MRVLGFVALLLLVNAGLAHWYREVVMAESLATRTSRGFEEVAADVEVLILGDSHSKWGVHPTALPGSYNLALPGQPYAESYYTLARVLERSDVDVDFVVIQVGLHSFEPRPVQWGQAFHYAPFVSYWRIGLRHGDLLEHVVRQFLGRHAPYVGQRFYILQYLQYREPAAVRWWYGLEMDRGAMPAEDQLSDDPPELRRRDANIAAMRHFKGRHDFDPGMARDFEDLLALAAEHGITVVAVKFPVSEEFMRAASTRVDVSGLDQQLAQLVSSYPNVSILDARSRFVAEPELFLNHTHLNTRGGLEMTKLIAEHIEALRSSEGPTH